MDSEITLPEYLISALSLRLLHEEAFFELDGKAFRVSNTSSKEFLAFEAAQPINLKQVVDVVVQYYTQQGMKLSGPAIEEEVNPIMNQVFADDTKDGIRTMLLVQRILDQSETAPILIYAETFNANRDEN